jgi:putative FmdB family regulatory protein
MPLYEYSCPKCGETREVLVRSSETAEQPVCPECALPMAKEWAPVAAHVKSAAGGGCSGPRGGFS